MATISNNEIKIKYTLDTTSLANATQLFDRLSAEDRQLLNDLKRLQAQLQQTGQAGQQAGRNISQGVNNARTSVVGLTTGLNNLGNVIVGAFSAQAIYQFGKSVLDTTIKMQGLFKAIEFTSKSADVGALNIRFLKKVSDELGLPLEAAAEGFRSFSAAAGRSGYTVAQQREMFLGLSEAMASLQLNAQSAGLVFFGFGQLMSKNKVSAQEIYHQIGERLPIAMEAAQIAVGRLQGKMKASGSEFDEMLRKGELMSSEFAPEFTKALHELGESGAYVETLGKDVTRLENAWEELKLSLGNSVVLKNIVMALKEVVDGVQDAIDVTTYYASLKWWNTGKTLGQYEEYQQDLMDVYDGILEGTKYSFAELENIQKEYNKTTKDESKESLEKRKELVVQYYYERIKVMNEYEGEVRAAEYKLKKAEESGNKEHIERAKNRLKAYKQVLAQGIPELKEFTPDPEDEEKARRKRQQALEDAYRKELDRLEAQKKAKEDILKATMEDNILLDIELAKNNEYWNSKMYSVDAKYAKMGLELAKNNKVKRAAEVKLDKATQVQLVEEANEKALEKEREYIAKAEEVLQDAARKRQQAMQTDEQNELAQTQDFYDDQITALTNKFNEAYDIAMADKNKQLELQRNYDAEVIRLKNGLNAELASIDQKYREQEQINASRNASDVAAIYIQAAGLRNANLAKSEQEKLDIQDETNKALISNEIGKNTKEMDLLAQNLGEYKTMSLSEKKDLNDKLIAQNVLLNEQLTEIDKAAEQRRYEIKVEKLQLTMQLAQTISDGINSIVQQQYANELTLLQKKYDQDIRLAGDNEQKKAQLQQDLEAKQKEIKIKQFNADKMAAIARIIFESASQIAANALNPVTLPYIIAIQAAQLAAVAAQPVPEFAEGTKGRKFRGGRAMVGERGTEKIITESGKVYYTPPTATLMDLPKGSQVIPNHALTQRELFWANAINDGRPINPGGGIENKLDRIGGILESLPVHQINMDERGFEKFIRTPRRTTKILNNRFPGVN